MLPTDTATPIPTDTPYADGDADQYGDANRTPATTPIPACGNSNIEAGENCDDGNAVGGDCCSATCQYESNGSACSSDGSTCTTDQCNGSGVCAHIDNGSCETSSESVSPGGTTTTDPEADGATPSDPVETSITSPTGGTISIEERPSAGSPSAFFTYRARGRDHRASGKRGKPARHRLSPRRVDSPPQPFTQAHIDIGYPFVIKDSVIVETAPARAESLRPSHAWRARPAGDGDVIVHRAHSTASVCSSPFHRELPETSTTSASAASRKLAAV